MFSEQQVMNSLPVNQQCTEMEAEVLLALYECKRKKYHTTFPTSKLVNTKPLSQIAKRTGKIRIANSTPHSGLNVGTPVPGTLLTSTTPDLPKINSKSYIVKTDHKKEEAGVEASDNPLLARLQHNIDLAVSEAERLYYNCDYQQCHNLTEFILKEDPYHYDCLPIHIACEVELKQSNSKFIIYI